MTAVGKTHLRIVDVVNGLHAFFTMRAPGSRVYVGHVQQEVSQEELISLPTSRPSYLACQLLVPSRPVRYMSKSKTLNGGCAMNCGLYRVDDIELRNQTLTLISATSLSLAGRLRDGIWSQQLYNRYSIRIPPSHNPT
jgi:hypothetical protein